MRRGEKWTWTIGDGADRRTVEATVRLVVEASEPCPHCGDYCQGYYRVWYVEDGIWVTATIDRPSLDAAFQEAVQLLPGDEMPEFLDQWNAVTGWVSADASPLGTRIRGEDLITVIQLASEHGNIDRLNKGALQSLLHFLQEAERNGRQLNIAEE